MIHQINPSQISLESIFIENCILRKKQIVAFSEAYVSVDDVLARRSGEVLHINWKSIL